MRPLSRPGRAIVAAVTAVLITALSVMVPLLDSGRVPGPVAIAESGAAGAGYVDHHHGVCLQHSAGAWTQTPGAELPSERFLHGQDAPRATTHCPGHTARSLHFSRAPPLV